MPYIEPQVAAPTIRLGETADLQDAVEKLWEQGERAIGLEGVYTPGKDEYSVLRITRELSGIAFMGVGSGARLDAAGRTSHVVVIDNADVTMSGLGIFGGNTTSPVETVRRYNGPKGRSAYEAMDGAGMLITGKSNVKLQNIVFGYNHSGMCGGGLSNQGTGLVQITNCEFVGNTAYHTGAAIDNLTPGAKLEVHRSRFEDNKSNQGSVKDGPHGQITVFRGTQATIRHCDFLGSGVVIDASEGSTTAYANKFNGHATSVVEAGGKQSATIALRHFGHLAAYSVPLLLKRGLSPWVRRT